MSFLKQILNPFIEFDEEKKKEEAKQNKSVPFPAAPIKQVAVPTNPPLAADENVEHPLITGSKTTAPPPDPTPGYSPGGTMTKPLPEHVAYFEKLIDEANRLNPIFQGTDFKEFVDSKIDIDDITDEALKYKTAY